MTLPSGVLDVVLGGGEQVPGNVISELEVLECDLGGDGGQDGYLHLDGEAGGQFEGDEVAQLGEVLEGGDHLQHVQQHVDGEGEVGALLKKNDFLKQKNQIQTSFESVFHRKHGFSKKKKTTMTEKWSKIIKNTKKHHDVHFWNFELKKNPI